MTQGIKAVIESYPTVGDILDHYGIGCVQCTDGSCRTGDILTLHALAPEDQATMIQEIEEAIQTGSATQNN
jgi:hypothetical protein